MSITPSSGNVFADLGHPHPDEALAKSELILQIATVMKSRNISLKKASGLLGIPPSKLSRLLEGRLAEFSIDCLTHYLAVLSENAEQENVPLHAMYSGNALFWHKIRRILQIHSL